MEPHDLFPKRRQLLWPPRAAHEQRPRVAEYTRDVSHQFVRGADVIPSVEIGVHVGCITQGFLGPIGNRGEKVPQHRSLGRVPGHIIRDMILDSPVLQGTLVRLEPLGRHHIDGLVAASAGDPPLYKWSPVPQDPRATSAYVETALKWRDEGRAVPFAIIRSNDGVVIG